jgi:hypothetical protein
MPTERPPLDTINKTKETLIYASKEVGLKVTVERTKNMLVPCYQTAG